MKFSQHLICRYWSTTAFVLGMGGAMTIALNQRPALSLGLACCESLAQMEAETDVIIRGRALMGVEDLEKIRITQAEYAAMQARGKKIPMGSDLVVHDGQWQQVDGYMIFPVKVVEVIQGKTEETVVGVFHQSSLWSTPLVKDAEYLFFLGKAEAFTRPHKAYFDFYGQGKFNLDGKDTQQPADSVGWFSREAAVMEKYGDRLLPGASPGQNTLGSKSANGWLTIVFSKVLQSLKRNI